MIQAVNQNRAAVVTVDGKMIDKPILAKAERIIGAAIKAEAKSESQIPSGVRDCLRIKNETHPRLLFYCHVSGKDRLTKRNRRWARTLPPLFDRAR